MITTSSAAELRAAERALQEGAYDDAYHRLRRILQSNPHQSDARLLWARCLLFLGQADAAIKQLRGLLTTPGISRARVQFNLSRAIRSLKGEAHLADFCSNLEPSQLAPKAFVACFPKSGSTFLTDLMANVAQVPKMYLFFEAHQQDQDLYLPKLAQVAKLPMVVQQHVRATEPNIQLMQAFGLRPIVLIRNVFDCLVSFRDMCAKSVNEILFRAEEFVELSPEAQLDIVVRRFAPWYFSFYASWVLAERDHRLPIRWLRYEDFYGNETSELSDLLAWSGLAAKLPPEQVWSDLNARPGATRKNIGRAGRGKEQLSQDQIAFVEAQQEAFPSIDFSLILR